MQAKYEYLTKKEVIDNIDLFKCQLRVEMHKSDKKDYCALLKIKFPLKNNRSILSIIHHSITIENVGRCRYNLTIQN